MHEAANDNVEHRSDDKRPVNPKPCPICGKPARQDSAPFCSRRCADVDLHRWLGGVYAIPAAESDDEGQDLGPDA